MLASSIDEYVKMLQFLDKAFSFSKGYSLTIRPHPLIDFRKALRLYDPKGLQYEIDKGILNESLKASDLVLYASSSVSLEAISMGIPVICIGLRDVLDTDPLFNMSLLKWTCKEPQELETLIKTISDIEKDCFIDIQKRALQFSRLYCVPISSESMESFVRH